jgi:hypothetical protein
VWRKGWIVGRKLYWEKMQTLGCGKLLEAGAAGGGGDKGWRE